MSWLDSLAPNKTVISIDSPVSRFGEDVSLIKRDEPRNPEHDDAKLAAYLLGGAEAVRNIEEVDAAKARTVAAWSEVAAMFAPDWLFELADELGTSWYLAKPVMYGCAKDPSLVPKVKELIKTYKAAMMVAEGSESIDALNVLHKELEELLGHRI